MLQYQSHLTHYYRDFVHVYRDYFNPTSTLQGLEDVFLTNLKWSIHDLLHSLDKDFK
jgi:hypothetical protein